MMKAFSLVMLGLAAGLVSSCSTSRETTTARTAVEMALLSESAERVIAKFDDPMGLAGKSFFMDLSEFKATDVEYLNSALRLRLLQMGMSEAKDKETADIVVFPRAGIHAIDDSKFLIGVPEIPVTVPGAGAISTPEIVLFRRIYQRSSSHFGAYAMDAKDSTLELDWGREWGTSFYTRWTILFLLNFRTTDLGAPYKKSKEEKAEQKAAEKAEEKD